MTREINGKPLYIKDIDYRVLDVFINGQYTGWADKVTKRDKVLINQDGSRCFKLWDTELVRKQTDGKILIYITSEHGKDCEYYHYRGREKVPAMTQTTRSRLDAFLSYYGFSRLEVHSSKKLFGVWHNGKELEDNSWYELDFTSHELVKVN